MKTSKNEISVNLDKLFASLKSDLLTKRFFALALKEIDLSGKSVVVFTEKELVKTKIYLDNSGVARRGLKKAVDGLLRMKVNGSQYFFSRMGTDKETVAYELHVNPAIDYKAIARGFRAFPVSALQSGVTSNAKLKSRPRKTRDVLYAVFLYAQEHVDELAKGGTLKISYRAIQKNMGWVPYKKWLYTRRFLEEVIASAFSIDRDISLIGGNSIGNEELDINKYLDESFIEVEFRGSVLKDFLGAFGLEPPKVKVEAPSQETSLFSGVEIENNEKRIDRHTLDMLGDLQDAAEKGSEALDALTCAAMGNLVDMGRCKDQLKKSCKDIVDILNECEMDYIPEMLDAWKDVLDCKKNNDSFYIDERVSCLCNWYEVASTKVGWILVKEFMSRLSSAGLLKYLKGSSTIYLWDTTLNGNGWSLDGWSVREIEGVMANLEKNLNKRKSECDNKVAV